MENYPRGQKRALPRLEEVEALLEFADRPFVDGLLTSVSLHGLWRCSASTSEYGHWAKSTLNRVGFVLGYHFTQVPSGDGPIRFDDPAIYVPVVHGAPVATSSTVPGREAARLIAARFAAEYRSLLTGGSCQPRLAELVAQAAGKALILVEPVLAMVRLVNGETRPLPVPGDVPALLAPMVRPFRDRRVDCVRASGLWSCTVSTRPARTWFLDAVSHFGLAEGFDYMWLPEDDRGVALVDIKVGPRLLRGATNEAAVCALEIMVAPLPFGLRSLPGMDALDGAGLEDRPDGVSAADGEEGLVADRLADEEPWAEAFDFGRLVPVAESEVGGVVQATVSARDVHVFLYRGRFFSNWIKQEVAHCGLVKGVDYEKRVFAKDGKNSPKGRPRIEYVLPIASAKKIAMSASGPRGNAVREYFLEQERRLLAGEPPVPGSAGVHLAELVSPIRAEPEVVVVAPALMGSMAVADIPLTINEFLSVHGADPGDAGGRGTMCDGHLRAWLAGRGRGVDAACHPSRGVWVYRRAALEAWWAAGATAGMTFPAP